MKITNEVSNTRRLKKSQIATVVASETGYKTNHVADLLIRQKFVWFGRPKNERKIRRYV